MANNIESRTEDNITHIYIKDGKRGNRVSDDMAEKLTEIIESAGTSSKAIVLETQGDNFCLGRAVMGEAPGQLPEALELRKKFDIIFDFYDSFRRVKIPVIGRIQGKAVGFGCAMAALCDITIAADTASFQLPETSHGIMPTMAMSSLIDRVGRKPIIYMTYGADFIDANHALSVGIVSQVVPKDELNHAIAHMVERIKKIPMPAIHSVKEFVTFSMDQPMPLVEQYARNLHATINSSEEMRKK